ncbi:lantibiotic dehydratase, partial [Acinetobacter baumannii]
IGLHNNRFYSKWATTGTHFEARSNNMLNHALVPNTIRFLLDISDDGISRIAPFDWRGAENLSYLPRVTHGRIIFRLAQWNLA